MPGGTKKPTGALIEALAGLLRAQAAVAKLTHQQVADAVGISRSQVSKIFDGEKQIDLELLDSICWAMGLSFRDTVLAADEKAAMRYRGPGWDTPTLVRS